MPDDPDIFVLNQPLAGLEQRSTKSGKQRFTLVVKSEPIAIDTNERRLMAPVAVAFAHHLQERVRAITAKAAPATIKARKVAAKAYAEGKSWAVRRYSGGRIGATPPQPGNENAFTDSGRFASSIKAGIDSKGTWRVNVAANRLDSATGNIERIYRRLISLVPDFADIGVAMQSNAVLKAMEQSMRNMITKGRETDKASGALSLAREIFRLGQNLAGIAGGE